MKRAMTFAVAMMLLLAGCGGKKRARIAPTPRITGDEVGLASWYGKPYHGRASASGEIYDMEQLTAAHRTLPFGTRVRVENLDNGLSVEVRINDRGPFVEGRVIDLSRAAARAIEMLGPGIARVKLHVVTQAEAGPSSYYAVQTGAFQDRANADRLRAEMEQRYGTARLSRRDGAPPLWRVWVGHEETQDGAAALAARMSSDGTGGFVVRIEAPTSN